jgi:hypothetical protein
MIAAADYMTSLADLDITPGLLDRLIAAGDTETLRLIHRYVTHPLRSFIPRPDHPENWDEQSGFVNDNESQFCICLGGNGSGKTEASAWKTANFLLTTKPKRDNLPFWVIGYTMDQVTSVCWKEKLSKYIPEECIKHISYYDRGLQLPSSVVLKHPDDPIRRGYVIQFKSYKEGVSGMKSTSIGGYWFNEETPFSLVHEVQRGTRDYHSRGWADFTPVEAREQEWIDAYEKPPPGWKFYHLNSLCNTATPDPSDPTRTVAENIREWLESVPEDQREMRTIGKFCVLQGQVFKEWRKAIHVCDPFRIPQHWRKVRGIDFGWNNPFCCLWVALDPDGCYWVYDEHYQSQRMNWEHVEAINKREWDDSQPWFGPTYSDHDAQQRGELAGLGINCTPANKSILQGIDALRALMMVQANGKPKLRVFKTCLNLIKELPSYRWPEGTSGRNPADMPLDKDNHALDALRYAIFSDMNTNRTAPIRGWRRQNDPQRRGVQFQR